MKNSICGLVFLFSLHYSWAQLYDNNWILGYLNEAMLINFEGNNPEIIPFSVDLIFLATNNTTSNSNGDFEFFSNGVRVYNASNELINNGDSLNPNEFSFGYYDSGYPVPDGMISVPDPGNPERYYLFHRDIDQGDFSPLKCSNLYYTLVDMSQNNGAGFVVAKNQLIHDAYWFDGSAAARHANGRDWWVITSEVTTNNYNHLLLTPQGIQDIGYQEIGEKPPYSFEDETGDDSGQNLFSPDGTKYIELDYFNGTRIFDFDRCTGLLSNFIWIQLPGAFSAGAAISPNSRYIYVSTQENVYQFDLQADDIEASGQIVAEYDGFNPFQIDPPVFRRMQLAPDGRIYIQGGLNYLHLINHPNLEGEACDFRQRGITLPYHIINGWPNYPYYRLGPIDGSSCDSLGINNIPVAHFTWEADTITPQYIYFTDNSSYEPATWLWDFDDGATSAEVNPEHEYTATGSYNVCLTVSNQYGSDTFCRLVPITSVDAENLYIRSTLSLSPNPAGNQVRMDYKLFYGLQDTKIEIADYTGRVVKTLFAQNTEGTLHISLLDIPAGVYFVTLKSGDVIFKTEKLVVVR